MLIFEKGKDARKYLDTVSESTFDIVGEKTFQYCTKNSWIPKLKVREFIYKGEGNRSFVNTEIMRPDGSNLLNVRSIYTHNDDCTKSRNETASIGCFKDYFGVVRHIDSEDESIKLSRTFCSVYDYDGGMIGQFDVEFEDFETATEGEIVETNFKMARLAHDRAMEKE